MDNLVTLCLLGVFLLVGFMLLTRLMRGFGGPDYSQRGPESPRYNDPDIDSRGGFGGQRGTERPTYDDPAIQSRGGFGRRTSIFSRRGSSGSSRRTDSPNVQSRGGFGRSK
jgi:hypothetical protein